MSRVPLVTFLQILNGSQKGKGIKILSSKILIGRSSQCDLIFKEDPLCSPEHALVSKEGDSYFVESLDGKNPVLLNKKAIQKVQLKQKDEIQIGKIKLRFIQKSVTKPALVRPQQVSPKKSFNPARLILVFLILGALALVLLEDSPPKDQARKLRLEADILEEVENLNNQNLKELKDLDMNFKQKTAQAAFISGFRDYRKGYFKRALGYFKHCLTIDRKNPLCRRYELQSVSQIEKLIEKKIRTGNAYLEKKQYSACEAVFRSVQIMMQDTSNPVYKEAEMKRRSCSIKLKNRI